MATFLHIYIVVSLQYAPVWMFLSIRIFEVLQTPDFCTMAAALPRKRAKFVEDVEKSGEVIPAVGL